MKPCCGGSTGTSVSYYRRGAWHSADCDIIRQEEASQEYSQTSGGLWTKPQPKCVCGADKTYGPGNNLHSATMPCPLYKKY